MHRPHGAEHKRSLTIDTATLPAHNAEDAECFTPTLASSAPDPDSITHFTDGGDPGEFPAMEKHLDIEEGFAREYLSGECLRPSPHVRTWMYCRVLRMEKDKFRMMVDGNMRFLLSAKRVGHNYYISHYEAFPDFFDKTKPGHYCAVLMKDPSERRFQLYSRSCERCDDVLQKYSCGPCETEERQLLAVITHRDRHIKEADVDARLMTLELPLVRSGTRIVWCPRAPRGTAVARRLRKEGRETSSSATDTMIVKSRLPEWNSELGSLVMKFVGTRVQEASSKNFVFDIERHAEVAGGAAGTAPHTVMQCGKGPDGEYRLDFRYPVAPVQAFAAMLSAFAWKKP